ncbi:hypothetical protein [Hymenobacter psoromatis]|uniref:hypothetical protein n=1 Tax=Hymenobacter psoromatis TaxID=1484116 RepID=UPI001CBA8431|nr:hypothetical protein [Hymenobacter psoromatis]
MKNPLLLFATLLTLGVGTGACTPNDKTDSTASTTDNAAAAADTVGARQQLKQDRAGVRLDSAGTTPVRGQPTN